MSNDAAKIMIDEDSFSLFDVPNLTGTPERRLLLAVLERAILDYVGNDSREVEEATTWLFGNEEGSADTLRSITPQFSFHWICQELDLDIEKISASIRSMPKRGSRRIAPWYFEREQAVQAS